MIEANGDLNMILREVNVGLLIVTLIPMIGTAIFVLLAFHRMGYGKVGKYLSFGFIVLVGSLVFGLINNIAGPNLYVQVIASLVRLTGWLALLIGFMYLYVEADRSIP